MKIILLLTCTVLFGIGYYLLNATNKCQEYPVTTGWIFNDTGNCDMGTTVSA
jgi:hypothetical protein